MLHGAASELARDQAGDAAGAVAALLDLGAVGIEDAVEDVGAGRARRHQHQRLVEADAGAAVGEAAQRCGGRQIVPSVGASKTMKSLPSPCILVNARRMAGKHTGCAKCREHASPAQSKLRQQHQTQREASMRHVMVMNSKGGCGKSTIATNLASHFAARGLQGRARGLRSAADQPRLAGAARRGSAAHRRRRGLRRRFARRAARHRGPGDRRAGAHARLGDERAGAPRRDDPGAGAALADRHEGVRALHGRAARARQGAAAAGAARASSRIACARTR